MFNIIKKSINWAGRELTIETGQVARQADGAVLCTYGDTTVLATAVGAKSAKPDQDFFPLTVHYQEKAYAAGKIPGGFFKREGRPSEKETLTSRLIDRPIRPLFVEGFSNEVQVVCTVISFDLENDPDIVALIAASAALTISGMPFVGPIGAARIGLIDDELVVNPLMTQMDESKLDLVAAATKGAVMMVESEAKELSKEKMLEAVELAKNYSSEAIDLIISVAQEAAKDPWDYTPKDLSAVSTEVEKLVGSKIKDAYNEQSKQVRVSALNEMKDEIFATLCGEEENSLNKNDVAKAIKGKESQHVRSMVLNDSVRIDGRKLDEIRQIECTPRMVPRTHGSALFTRGETQALVVATLGTGDDEQMLDQLDGMKKETFMLHYNFPPYSVGETGRMGTPGRREIGHGKLAWRAIRPILPSQDEFPYVLRVVSEITESNGSSSMATVCGTSLALMDAGVPLSNHVAGIAMGLILEDGKFAVLSDILGDEDHLGDMDFKVAGTQNGITSLQMDIKIAGITKEIMAQALDQAGNGIDHILGVMNGTLANSRSELGEFAPRIETITINPSKIREVIGSGGKVIREIVEQTGAKIDISDEGLIKVASTEKAKIDKAIEWIRSITDEPVPGTTYKGKIVKVVDFGAFVNFFGAKDGLVHISQLANERVKQVSDVVSEGQEVFVKFIGSDDRGKVKLSMKVVDQETGKDIEQEEK